ncbi:Manganese/iron superoxide dismutase [Catenaria anguillulae PL171]|uniref:Superoxide dismutase n=1 Tax=Catenaria anguillulae PL171 TaxID=765915 RepID=A0A1Y2HXD2_9FUNG|nr:Manganese/iron superoxide dismutase [Catenaria anguillulae PL171]
MLRHMYIWTRLCPSAVFTPPCYTPISDTRSTMLAKSAIALARPTLARAATGAAAVRAKHTLPDLPYDYNALEPVVSAEIMKLHHSKHHQAYVTNLNVAEEKFAEAQVKKDIASQIALQPALKFNGGGHINHTIFWTNLCSPKDFDLPQGELLKAIQAEFGSLDNLVTKFNTQTAAVQGSGWGWLGVNKETKRLQIATTANQDPLAPTTGLVPILGIDVWEHAYYLDYKNARPDYLKAIWGVVNWKNVAERFAKARA